MKSSSRQSGGVPAIFYHKILITNALQEILSSQSSLSGLVKQRKSPKPLLSNGQPMLSNGSAGLSCIAGALRSGSGHWKNGSERLSNGSEQLSNGSEQLSNGSERLSNGSERLSNGSKIRYRQGGYLIVNYLLTINHAS